jgi:hypothetical protein
MVFKESTIVRHLDSINRQTKRKEAWAKCYLETHDIKICNETTGFKIYPDDAKIQAKLKYLESNNLSFFKEQK